MEAETAAIAAAIGVLVSTWLLWDAWIDRRIHRKYYLSRKDHHPLVGKLIFDRMIGETVRLIVQLLFLTVGVIFFLERSAFFKAATWLLVAVPVVLTLWSIYAWIRRLQVLFDNEEVHRRAGT